MKKSQLARMVDGFEAGLISADEIRRALYNCAEDRCPDWGTQFIRLPAERRRSFLDWLGSVREEVEKTGTSGWLWYDGPRDGDVEEFHACDEFIQAQLKQTTSNG